MTNWQFGSQFAVEFEGQTEKGFLDNGVFCEKPENTTGLAVVELKNPQDVATLRIIFMRLGCKHS